MQMWSKIINTWLMVDLKFKIVRAQGPSQHLPMSAQPPIACRCQHNHQLFDDIESHSSWHWIPSRLTHALPYLAYLLHGNGWNDVAQWLDLFCWCGASSLAYPWSYIIQGSDIGSFVTQVRSLTAIPLNLIRLKINLIGLTISIKTSIKELSTLCID